MRAFELGSHELSWGTMFPPGLRQHSSSSSNNNNNKIDNNSGRRND